MTLIWETTTQGSEGIDVATSTDGGFTATVLRRDTTDITVHRRGFAHEVSKRAAAGGYVLIDRNVHAAWREQLALPADSYLIVEPGEQYKNLEQVACLVDELHQQGVHRIRPLIAVGGGTTTDVVGLVGSLYFRGVPVVNVPTTLLGMIDAAIGGKTGVNHPRQKNLIGSFTHPTAVAVCLDSLDTVPHHHTVSALGEAVKLAVADDSSDLFSLLTKGVQVLDDAVLMEHIVRTCIATKLRLLGPNCFERDLARVLNLGHTVAHPLEDITSFRIPHGTAVAIGVAVASHISHQRHLLDEHDLDRILTTIRRLTLPVMDDDFDPEQLISRIEGLVLQRGGSSLHYVLPTAIGKTEFTDKIYAAEVHRAISELSTYQGQTA
ncbi:3-dehydroquinate synthase family protein [Streptomyces sp. NPDC056465]|uniref:3-dehydroquinate synthase family protein n=1 Tax=Streptomyces sp. NPDC056465 TaxID=3345829 RepID=UPI00368BF38D